MNLFEGDIFKRPQQSLRGASHNINKENLLLSTQLQRQEREKFKQQNIAALVIQRSYRGYIIRKHLNNNLRQRFDNYMLHTISSVQKKDMLVNYLKTINLFYHCDQDQKRYLSLAKIFVIMVNNNEDVLNIFLNNIYICKRFYLFSLDSIASNKYQYPFRLFQILNEKIHDTIFKLEIYNYLAKNGYFKLLLTYINQKMSLIYIPQDLKALPYDIKYAIELIFYPLYLINQENRPFDNYILFYQFYLQLMQSSETYCLNKTSFLIAYKLYHINDINFVNDGITSPQSFPHDKFLLFLLQNLSLKLNVYFLHNFLLLYTMKVNQPFETSFHVNYFQTLSRILDSTINDLTCYSKLLDETSSESCDHMDRDLYDITILPNKLNTSDHDKNLKPLNLFTSLLYMINQSSFQEILFKTLSLDSESDISTSVAAHTITINAFNVTAIIAYACILFNEYDKKLTKISRENNSSDGYNVIKCVLSCELRENLTLNHHSRLQLPNPVILYNAILLKLAYNFGFMHEFWVKLKSDLTTNDYNNSGKPLHTLLKGPYLNLYTDKHVPNNIGHQSTSILEDQSIRKEIPTTKLSPIRNSLTFNQRLELFCYLLNVTLNTLKDAELYHVVYLKRALPNPLTTTLIKDVPDIITYLKRFILDLVEYLIPININLMVKKDGTKFYESRVAWIKIFKICSALLRRLYMRNSRLEFTDGRLWLFENKKIWDQIDQVDPVHFNTNFGHDAKDPFVLIARLIYDSEDSEQTNLMVLPDSKILKGIILLKYAYFVLPFTSRVQLFNRLYLNYEKSILYSNNNQRWLHSGWQQSHGWTIDLNIRRQFLYEDSFQKLSSTNEPNLKLKTRVRFINRAGAEEAGVDGGGLFREYLSQLLLTGFDANRGLFKHSLVSKVNTERLATLSSSQIIPKQGDSADASLPTSSSTQVGGSQPASSLTLEKELVIYPNPDVYAYFGFFSEDATVNRRETLKHYFFLGRVLGKAIYENLLVELPLAHYFLSKILQFCSQEIQIYDTDDPTSSENQLFTLTNLDLNDLQSLDPVLYKNLNYLVNYSNPDEIPEVFQLDFSVLEERFGQLNKVDLIPDGSNIIVTGSNRLQYVYLLADYKLNKQLDPACKAFAKGLMGLIDPDWLTLFSPSELRVLICGTPGPIDVQDWRDNTVYSGGYSITNETIQNFWDILRHELNDHQRSLLLKFVTSCSRPPLLGFKELNPSFCIQNSVKPTITSSATESDFPLSQNTLTTYTDMYSDNNFENLSQQQHLEDLSNQHQQASVPEIIDQLPTASTCMNLLKLPPFPTKLVMRQKLLYAINSMSGFELS